MNMQFRLIVIRLLVTHLGCKDNKKNVNTTLFQPFFCKEGKRPKTKKESLFEKVEKLNIPLGAFCKKNLLIFLYKKNQILEAECENF